MSKRSKISKVLRKVAACQYPCFEVLVACAENADADGYFPLDEKTVTQIGKRCHLALWQVEHNLRKLVYDFQEIEADSLMEEAKLRSFGSHKVHGKVFVRDDHRGRLAYSLRLALREVKND